MSCTLNTVITSSHCVNMEMDEQNQIAKCVAIKFETIFEYCEINLNCLTRDSFLNDGIESAIL